MTSLAPVNNGQKISHSETSNPDGVFCRNTSPGLNSYAFCIQIRRLHIPSWQITTPFGEPVDPEVYIRYAGLCDVSGLTRSIFVGLVSRLCRSNSKVSETSKIIGRRTPNKPPAKVLMVTTRAGLASCNMKATRSAG